VLKPAGSPKIRIVGGIAMLVVEFGALLREARAIAFSAEEIAASETRACE
jgi:hypothetical protein